MQPGDRQLHVRNSTCHFGQQLQPGGQWAHNWNGLDQHIGVLAAEPQLGDSAPARFLVLLHRRNSKSRRVGKRTLRGRTRDVRTWRSRSYVRRGRHWVRELPNRLNCRAGSVQLGSVANQEHQGDRVGHAAVPGGVLQHLEPPTVQSASRNGHQRSELRHHQLVVGDAAYRPVRTEVLVLELEEQRAPFLPVHPREERGPFCFGCTCLGAERTYSRTLKETGPSVRVNANKGAYKGELVYGNLEARARGAEIVAQSGNVGSVGTDATGIHWKPEALSLLDAHTGIV